MRKISADYIFPVSAPPIKNGVVVVDEEGIIVEVTPPPTPSSGGQDIEKYSGVIVPGFVNTHCHLELSHLKGQVSEKKGLIGFISELIPKRNQFSAEQINAAIIKADEEMHRNGIVAVGDISNTDHSFEQKGKSKIQYHTFIEVFDLIAAKAEKTFQDAKLLTSAISHQPFSITPHSPYSISGKLLELIDSLKPPILSVHSQETSSEEELFISGTGTLAELMRNAGVDIAAKQREKSSLLFLLSRLLESEKIMLVHNTYTTKKDVELIKNYMHASGCEIAMCLCPGANLYIENRLPDVPMLLEAGMKLTLGTDSYASNWNLSILDEMKIISKHFPQIPFETMLIWATKNGAELLGFDKELGIIEKGKKPGLNLITGIDLEKMELGNKMVVRRLI